MILKEHSYLSSTLRYVVRVDAATPDRYEYLLQMAYDLSLLKVVNG